MLACTDWLLKGVLVGVLVNLTHVRVIWEAGPSIKNILHQMDL